MIITRKMAQQLLRGLRIKAEVEESAEIMTMSLRLISKSTGLVKRKLYKQEKRLIVFFHKST